MSAERTPTIAVAITGASGALYATRTLAALLSRGMHVELVISDYGRRLLHDELGEKATLERLMPYLAEKYGADVERGTINLHSNRDLGATIASGSHGCRGMVIVPCSMKTLAEVATGLGDSLISRAADVTLKERRRLVLVARETPLSLVHLRNMTAATEAGAIVFPPVPAFYTVPASIDDMITQTVGRILDLFDISVPGIRRWGEEIPAPGHHD